MLTRRSTRGLLAASAILPSRAFANVAPPLSEVRERLAKRFADVGTAGTFVGYKTDDYMIILSDKERSAEPRLPASTFKIPNSLIALETAVVQDPDKDIFPWDGVKRDIEAWNRDHTLRSAIAVSAVPVYQEIARRIGEERMQKYVDLFEYGNRDIGGGIDQFWLTGNLRIDPMDQIDFVDRLRRRALPISKHSQDLVCDISSGDAGRVLHHPCQVGADGEGAGLARLDGRLGREGRCADRVRAQHGLSRATPHRRPHEPDEGQPCRYRRNLAVWFWR